MKNEVFSVLKALSKCEEDPYVNIDQIQGYYGNDTKTIEEALRTLSSKGLITKNHSGDEYKIDREGLELVHQRQLDSSIKNLDYSIKELKWQQARSAAVSFMDS